MLFVTEKANKFAAMRRQVEQGKKNARERLIQDRVIFKNGNCLMFCGHFPDGELM